MRKSGRPPKVAGLVALVVLACVAAGTPSARAATSWAEVVRAQCGGTRPRDCDVEISAGQDVELSGDAEAASVTVKGKLRWSDRTPSTLTAGFIVAEGPSGVIEVGRPGRPAPEGSRIYIRDNGREHRALGKRSFGSFMRGAIFHVHGRPLDKTWMLLSQPAWRGSTSLSLDGDANAAGWRVGDRIVVAPTTSYPKFKEDSKAEVFQVKAVNGATVTLDRPLQQDHGGFPSRRVQAEVINLSRTVTITGDNFDGQRHGLHVVAHSGAGGVVRHARVEKGGQFGVAGKYPLHFHQAGLCPPERCAFVGNAVEDSSQRGIIVHGSHRTLVSQNVLFDLKGSYLYVEDGNEMENVIEYNVAICPIKNGCKVAGTDNGQADNDQQSGMWALSVSNDFVGNRLVNHYNGFFTQTSAFPHGRGSAQGRVCTMYAPFGKISGNVCHSNERFGFYLDNNFPRNLKRSVATNGVLDKGDFWAHIDGDPSTLSSCDAFTESGGDNGVTAIVEDQLEIGNSFSGQYALGDVQFLRWHSINNLHGIYWKETKAMANKAVTAHIKDSTFEWISSWDNREIRAILGSPESGVAAIAGPGGLGAFVIENTKFKGHLGEAIAANQHCGLTGTGGLCTPEYQLVGVDFSELNEGSRKIKFGISDGNPVLPMFSSFDGSLEGHQSLANAAQTHLLGLPGNKCRQLNERDLDNGIACSVPLRRLQVWSSTGLQPGGAVLVAPGNRRWNMEFIGPPGNNRRKQAYGAAVAPGHKYIVELDRDDGITVEFSDLVYGTQFPGEEFIDLELRFRSEPGANRMCRVSSQHSRAFIDSNGPLFDGLGACPAGTAPPVTPLPAPEPVMGCMNQAATNFNSGATQDDGSCTFPSPAQQDTTPPAAQGSGPEFSDNFQSYSANSANLSPWETYVNTYSAEGDWQGWYGNGPAPANGPQVSQLVSEGSNKLINTYSKYDDPNHNNGLFLETNIYRGLGGAKISSDMTGRYRFSFTAKSPSTMNCGSTNGNNGAGGGTCYAFVKVIHSRDFNLLVYERVETTSASRAGETLNVDFELTDAHVGHDLQVGFMNYAGRYAPTGMFYDNVRLERTSAAAASVPQPVAVMGCMNQAATNFNAQATQDDGSCAFPVPGCMDQGATNFNAGATQDDGSCEFPMEQQTSAAYPATDPEMKCFGSNSRERRVERACDQEMLTWPNPFSGEGYYTIDMRCLTTSLVGCVAQTGCRLCHTEPSSWQGASGYAKCPSCVCDKWEVDEEGACLA